MHLFLPSWLQVSLRAWMFLHDLWRLSNDGFCNATVSFFVNPFVRTVSTGELLTNVHEIWRRVRNGFSLNYTFIKIVVSYSKEMFS
jgi:hypothetical protein